MDGRTQGHRRAKVSHGSVTSNLVFVTSNPVSVTSRLVFVQPAFAFEVICSSGEGAWFDYSHIDWLIYCFI